MFQHLKNNLRGVILNNFCHNAPLDLSLMKFADGAIVADADYV